MWKYRVPSWVRDSRDIYIHTILFSTCWADPESIVWRHLGNTPIVCMIVLYVCMYVCTIHLCIICNYMLTCVAKYVAVAWTTEKSPGVPYYGRISWLRVCNLYPGGMIAIFCPASLSLPGRWRLFTWLGGKRHLYSDNHTYKNIV